MRIVREGWGRLSGLWRRAALEREMDEEMRFHVDMQTEKNLRLGMGPAEARRRALVSFGGAERFKEEGRDEQRARWLEEGAQDVRYAVRMLRNAPGFTLVAVASLALGIGANTAVFSVVNAVLLRPLPYPAAERLLVIEDRRDGADEPGGLSVADVRALEERARVFAAVGAYSPSQAGTTLTRFGGGAPELLDATAITAGMLPALGVAPALGRGPLPAEDREGGARVVVLSHAFWRDRFARAPDVLGRSLTLDGAPHTIVGVMPEGFAIPGRPTDDLWPVLQLAPPRWRAPFWLRTVARLEPGVTEAQARAALGTVEAAVKAQFPDAAAEWRYVATPLKESLVRGTRTTVLVLYGAVLLILLMTAANVANLFMARATVRAPEIAIRAALGAGRGRIARQLLTESALVALAGGALGLLFAAWGVRVLAAATPGALFRAHEVGVDGPVLLFTLAVALLTGTAIGLVPALQVPRRQLAGALREGGRSGVGGARRRVQSLLVVAEYALALTVLIGAGLVVGTLLRLQRVDPGVERAGVLVVRLPLPEARYREEPRAEAFYDEVMRRMRERPGVTAVSVSMAVPPNRLVMRNPFTPQGKTFAQGESAPVAEELLVSADYFRLLGVPVVRGRAFTDADRSDAPPVAIVNETLARRYFAGRDAVGQWLQTGDPDPESTRLAIVGVVPDVKYQGLDAATEPTIYVPYAQNRWWRSMYLLVRASGDPMALVPAVRAAVAAADPEVPLQEVRTLDGLMFESVAAPRFRAGLLGAFGVVALLLAGAGIYGVLSYTVSQRQRETGVRLALGARRADIVRLIVRDGMRLALLGVAVGALMAAALTRLMRGVLYEVSPLDPVTFGTMALFLAVVGLAACVVPARRASRVDPMVSLRGE